MNATNNTASYRIITTTTIQNKPCLLSHESLFNYHCVTSLKTLTPHITCLAVQHNLLYAASLNIINVFDVSHYTHIDAFNDDHASGFVKSIAFGDSKIFTAHQDCKIRVWFITPSKRHRLLFTLPTVKDRLRRFMLPENYVHVRRHKRRLWIQHCDTVSGLAVNEGLMYSVSWDKSFKIWDVSDYRCMESVKAHEDAINAVAVSGTGTVYTASADGSIRVWERDEKVKKYRLVNNLEKQLKSTVNALALNDDGTVLFAGGCDSTISMWERKQGTNDVVLLETLRGHSGAILCLINVEGWIASGSADQTVRIWGQDRGSGYSCKAVLEGHEKPIKSLVAFSGGVSANGVVTLFSGSLDGDIKVWEVFGLNLPTNMASPL